MSSLAFALARADLIRTLTAYSGITTADGAADGSTLIDSNLIDSQTISAGAIPEKTILIMSGDAKGEDKGSASYSNVTGTVTLQGTGYSAQIMKGTIYKILNISSVEIDIADIDTKIGTNTDAVGTTTLFAWLLKLFEQGGQGLVYYGKVTTYTDVTHFRVAGLTGFGDDYFANNYRVYVVWDKDGAGAAPQTEMQPCTDYDSTDGIFTHIAFTAPLEVDDEVLLIHERLAEIADILEDTGTTLPATLAIIDGFHDIPGVDAVTNAQMRDVIGGKADTPIFLPDFNVSSIIRYLKGLLSAKVKAYGAADAGSDADTLVDAARTEANDYWNGMTLLMITGNNAGLTRRIYDYAVGSIEVRDAFPNAIVATDAYVILSDYEALLAAVDSVENLLVRDVIGSKADTASETAVDTDSLVSYLKGLLAITGTRATAAAYATSATGVLIAYAKALVDAGIAVQAAVSDAGPLVGDFDTDLTEASNDHYNGMLMMFIDGNLAGQAHLVDDYVGAAKNCMFATSDQWTEAPANGDKFVLLPSPGAYLKKIYDAVADLITRTKGLDDIHDDLAALAGLSEALVTKALTFANNTGQVNLFTVTGDVLVRLVAVVKTGCATGTACNVSVGTAAIVDAIIPVTDITLLAAQEIWHDATPDKEIEALSTLREYIISDGNDITLNSSAADNSGAITFYCFWKALSAGATVVAA